jgi:hypothetical protein
MLPTGGDRLFHCVFWDRLFYRFQLAQSYSLVELLEQVNLLTKMV